MKKRIVVCADGTWNRPEVDLEVDVPTNVLRLARSVAPVAPDGVPQQVFYDWGVGSDHDRLIGGMTGRGLHKNIMDDYRYVVQNYAPGDELYLFGFSRGAYTIRSLCGMIHNVGVLRRPDARLIQAAFLHYKDPRDSHHPDGEESVRFREAHSHPRFRIRFVGVWDTVGAMGIPLSFLGAFEDKDEFYDTKIGPNVDVARHAMAIDEHRRDFEPTVWQERPGMDLKQVWFAGAHSDVGGGYPRDPGGGLLADHPLAWMVAEVGEAGLACEPHLSESVVGGTTSTVHESYRTFYRLKRRLYRPLDHGHGPTRIHGSVQDRYAVDESYRPNNLQRYLQQHGGWGTVVRP